jgi:hypothetical protein
LPSKNIFCFQKCFIKNYKTTHYVILASIPQISHPGIYVKSKMQDTQEKKAVNKIILEEIERINKTIPIHTNGFVETYDTRDEPVFMAVKIIPSGLLAVFYGEDDYTMAPDPAKPFYVPGIICFQNRKRKASSKMWWIIRMIFGLMCGLNSQNESIVISSCIGSPL